MEKYRFLPHTADVMFEAFGETLEELFENAALALEETMVKTSTIKCNESYEITLNSGNPTDLLYDFLSELIFVKDTEGLLFSKFGAVISHEGKEYKLFAKCEGEKINQDKHELLDDAKAITMHEFEVVKDKDRWYAKVIVDV